ncbi:uncharacterized protein LOC128552293 [Mercenaria mercenaria]|uniref:uncharacterized protein LOC128552293 n=1 Tax=Mercenaria mercenaria TaxID=6596 RepID=UPI00234EBAB4|nr:uncharacterized protein LOC128552293 [Mercenaria mercenaria]
MSYLKPFIFLCVFIVKLNSATDRHNKNNRFIIESRGDFTDKLTRGLRKLKFSLYVQITSSVYIFEYQGNGNEEHATEQVMNNFRDQIQAIELTRIYNNTLKPVNAKTDGTEKNWNKVIIYCS